MAFHRVDSLHQLPRHRHLPNHWSLVQQQGLATVVEPVVWQLINHAPSASPFQPREDVCVSLTWLVVIVLIRRQVRVAIISSEDISDGKSWFRRGRSFSLGQRSLVSGNVGQVCLLVLAHGKESGVTFDPELKT